MLDTGVISTSIRVISNPVICTRVISGGVMSIGVITSTVAN